MIHHHHHRQQQQQSTRSSKRSLATHLTLTTLLFITISLTLCTQITDAANFRRTQKSLRGTISTQATTQTATLATATAKITTTATTLAGLETTVTNSSRTRVPFDWYLTNLKAVQGASTVCPRGIVKRLSNLVSDGMIRSPQDLNTGTGADPIYLCKDRVAPSSNEPAIVAILAHATDLVQWTCPPGWKSVGSTSDESSTGSLNLNKGAGGMYVRLCYQTAAYKVANVVANVKIIVGNSADDQPKCPAPFVDLAGTTRVNFNAGAGGHSVYMCLRTIPDPRT